MAYGLEVFSLQTESPLIRGLKQQGDDKGDDSCSMAGCSASAL